MAAEKPSMAWYMLAVFFPIIGGIIAYFLVKEKDQRMADSLLFVSFLVFLFTFWYFFILGLMAGFFAGFYGT